MGVRGSNSRKKVTVHECGEVRELIERRVLIFRRVVISGVRVPIHVREPDDCPRRERSLMFLCIVVKPKRLVEPESTWYDRLFQLGERTTEDYSVEVRILIPFLSDRV